MDSSTYSYKSIGEFLKYTNGSMGLAGWRENGRIITTANQAGTLSSITNCLNKDEKLKPGVILSGEGLQVSAFKKQERRDDYLLRQMKNRRRSAL